MANVVEDLCRAPRTAWGCPALTGGPEAGRTGLESDPQPGVSQRPPGFTRARGRPPENGQRACLLPAADACWSDEPGRGF